MEEIDYMKISTVFGKGVISNILKKIIFKKTGINLDELCVRTLEISDTSSNDTVAARLDVSVVVKKDDITKLMYRL